MSDDFSMRRIRSLMNDEYKVAIKRKLTYRMADG